jgi:DNA modification methylase
MVSVIRQGDALETLKTFVHHLSIDCCITSPPYYALRDYSRCQCTNGKIKVRSDYATHYKIAQRGGENSHMPKPDPTCPKCNGLGVNSAVASSQIGLEKTILEYINKLMAVFDEVKRVLKKEGTCWIVLGDTYQNKLLCMIPERFSLAMIDRGWILRNKICWQLLVKCETIIGEM